MGGIMNACRGSIVVVLLLLPLASLAEELNLGVTVTGAYEHRDRTSATYPPNEYLFRIAPHASLEEHEGDFQWELGYRPSYERWIEVSESSGWNHQANGGLSWQINPSLRLEASDRFGYFNTVSGFNEVVTTGEGDDVVDVTGTAFRDDSSARNSFRASLTHNLAPNQMLTFNLSHNLIDFSRDERIDRQSLGATLHYTRTVSPRNTLGGGVSYRRASADSIPDGSDQSTNFYNLFGSWVYRFDETLDLSVAAGPTWVVAEDPDNVVPVAQNRLLYPLVSVDGENRLVKATSCPRESGTLILTGDCDVIDENLTNDEVQFLRSTITDLFLVGSVPSGSNEQLTYFANVALNKSWERWSGVLSYRRQQSDSSGVRSSSTVADILSGALEWRPSPRWNAFFRAAYTRQTSATDAVQTVVAVMPVDLFSGFTGRTFENAAQSIGLRTLTVDQDQHIDTLWLTLGARYRITKRISLLGNATYWIQRSDVGDRFDYSRFRVDLGVSYNFDPIRL
jgi:hypothetical protein